MERSGSPSLERVCWKTGKRYAEQDCVFDAGPQHTLARDFDKSFGHHLFIQTEGSAGSPATAEGKADARRSRPSANDKTEDVSKAGYETSENEGDAPAACQRSPRSAHKVGLIYKITHLESGKAYVGLTRQTFVRRMQGHKTMALRERPRPGCNKLNAAVRKHGWEAFSKEVLYANVPEDLLSGMEIVCIAMHGTHSRHGYNLTAGGELSPFEDSEVQARAMRTKNSDAGRERRRKAFSDAGFKEKVGRGSKQRWNELAPAEHQARAQKQANGRHAEFVRRREAKIATLTPGRGRYYWNRQKRTCIGRVRRRMKAHPERFIGMDPIADLEAWWGPSFEERRRE
jgi:hypothetical protein